MPAPLLGLVAAIALAQTPPGHSLLRLAGLVKPPASYSALYFTDPAGLPATLPSGHVAVNVSFAVRNAAQSANSYRWTVELMHGGKRLSTASGTMTVPAGGTEAEKKPMTTVCRSGVLDVIVRLAAPAESIHFKAVCGG